MNILCLVTVYARCGCSHCVNHGSEANPLGTSRARSTKFRRNCLFYDTVRTFTFIFPIGVLFFRCLLSVDPDFMSRNIRVPFTKETPLKTSATEEIASSLESLAAEYG